MWADGQPSPEVCEQRGFLKTALNLVVLAEETLAYGGIITMRGNIDGCHLEIVGRNAQLSPLLQGAYEGTVSVEDVSPRSIQAYITGKFAENFGLRLKFDQPMQDRLDLSLLLPEVSAQSEELSPVAASL